MKKNLLLLLLTVTIAAAGCKSSREKKSTEVPRIAIAGIAIESSTFSPAVTVEEDFHARYKEEVFSYYPFMHPESSYREKAEWIPTLRGHAMPGGIVKREAYESLVKQTVDMLEEAGEIDGLFLDIHGAMSVVDLDDAEGDFIARIREVIGPDPIISTCMDLHGSVSKRLAKKSDLITCFRMAPHEDALESKQRAVDNLLDRLLNDKGKPKYKAWIPVPILLPGEKTSTRVEPAKSLYAKIEPATKKEGVIDAAIWMSYPWADEPRNHAVVMATGDDKDEVTKVSQNIAEYFWEVREEFEFIAPTTYLTEALNMAINSSKKPYIISDMGDNPTAGGAGDVTWTITEILKRDEFKTKTGPSLIYASLPDSKFVKKAVEIGEGGKISGYAGANVDNRYAGPVHLNGTIKKIFNEDERAGTIVVIETGSVKTIVTEKRKAYHRKSDFTDLGLDPKNTDIVVVKIGYLVPELYDMRDGWVMALTPGGVDQDIERLEYNRVNRPIFPLDRDMEDPDLTPRFIPSL
ncbi:M81 family metallopeptidase [Marinilabiliaceae bacterium ANBcel2]|nr:M81 family metallopeptidase [Marinilabiliaceae bacterium ANBcel2]